MNDPQSMGEPLPISGLNHVALVTRRLAASRAFYCQVLGFREVRRPNFDFAGAWLFNDGLMLHLIESEKAPDPIGEIETRCNHLALHSDDLEAVERGLQSRGIAFRRNRMAGDGIPQIFLRDPDGHHIEVSSRLPTPPWI